MRVRARVAHPDNTARRGVGCGSDNNNPNLPALASALGRLTGLATLHLIASECAAVVCECVCRSEACTYTCIHASRRNGWARRALALWELEHDAELVGLCCVGVARNARCGSYTHIDLYASALR